jgi:hypothetical protein
VAVTVRALVWSDGFAVNLLMMALPLIIALLIAKRLAEWVDREGAP